MAAEVLILLRSGAYPAGRPMSIALESNFNPSYLDRTNTLDP
jgi:hypothetical protein